MTRVLVPVAVLEGEAISPGLMTLLGTVDVTVLGYHVLPEQTPPDQARLQFEDRATDALEDIAEEFRAAGGAAEHRLVFTQDREKSIDRIAGETNARAVALSGPTGDVDRLLVALSGDVAVERILGFVEELVGDREIGVTLFLVTGVADDADARSRLESANTRLQDAGLDTRTELVTAPPFEGLVDAATGHDVIVMGETAPSIRSLLFGEESERVASASVGPVIVVRDHEQSGDG